MTEVKRAIEWTVTRVPVFYRLTRPECGNYNLPNCITISRVVAVPFICALLLIKGGSSSILISLSAVLIYLIAAATDGLDGFIARAFNIVTSLGKKLDPIADKLLLIPLLFLVLQGLWWWIVALIFAREIFIVILRYLVNGTEDENALDVRLIGKWKATMQYIGTAYAILELPYFNLVMMPAVILTEYSGVIYYLNYRKVN